MMNMNTTLRLAIALLKQGTKLAHLTEQATACLATGNHLGYALACLQMAVIAFAAGYSA